MNMGIVVNESSSALIYSTFSNFAELYLAKTLYLVAHGDPVIAILPLSLAVAIYPSRIAFLVPLLAYQAFRKHSFSTAFLTLLAFVSVQIGIVAYL